jgi:solute carrier family 10 (sodium/bile acid cotransporter), member 7
MLCVVSNLLGIVTVPFILKGILSNANTSLNAVSLLLKLAVTILVPLILGKLAQDCVPGVKGKVKAHRMALTLINNGSLTVIVWQTISDAQVRVACGGCAGARWQ